VGSDFQIHGVGSQVRHLAQKIHWSFSIGTFQFTIGRTHAAHGLELATGAFGLAGYFFLPDTE
jgi:hypothetical protein